ncbi:MAG TPA: tetratricopeptide repeat protein [Steroidobacteraceae bacterium]|nr:tetratricopeptide repeat protein [Steroidobacteraceae bacterium]
MSEYNEAEQYERFKAWIRANSLWIVVGVAIGAAGWGGWKWYWERRDLQAETAATRYEEMIDAFGRNDRTRGLTIADDLNREYAWTPYAALANLMAARVHVEANELDKAAASLKAVMDKASDPELRMVARMRLARVQSAQKKFDEALATLKVDEPGDFATRLADVRGDVLFAKGDREGALREYLAARTGDAKDSVDTELLDLKIRDLGGTPPAATEETS